MTGDFISVRLANIADEIMEQEFTLSHLRRKRDEMIVEARDAGVSLRRIAELCMISHQTVANICERNGADGARATTTGDAARDA